MRQLLPLLHQGHALGIDQSVAMDASQHDEGSGFHIRGLVHRRHIAERAGFGVRTGWRRLQRAQLAKVVHFTRKSGIASRITLMRVIHYSRVLPNYWHAYTVKKATSSAVFT